CPNLSNPAGSSERAWDGADPPDRMTELMLQARWMRPFRSSALDQETRRTRSPYDSAVNFMRRILAPSHRSGVEGIMSTGAAQMEMERPAGPAAGGLAYAVYPTAGPALRPRLRRAPRHRIAARRIVVEDVSDEMLLKSIAEGDKAAMHIMF